MEACKTYEKKLIAFCAIFSKKCFCFFIHFFRFSRFWRCVLCLILPPAFWHIWQWQTWPIGSSPSWSIDRLVLAKHGRTRSSLGTKGRRIFFYFLAKNDLLTCSVVYVDAFDCLWCSAICYLTICENDPYKNVHQIVASIIIIIKMRHSSSQSTTLI